MNEMNQNFNSDFKYQVWVTSWPEDGSAAETACTRYHAAVRLIGQTNDIAEAVKIYNTNKTYDPVITKSVTWRNYVEDTTL